MASTKGIPSLPTTAPPSVQSLFLAHPLSRIIVALMIHMAKRDFREVHNMSKKSNIYIFYDL